MQKRHTTGASKFNIGIQEKSSLSHAGSANHKGMHIALVNKSNRLFSMRFTADYRSLNCWQISAFSPVFHIKWDLGIGLFYLCFCGKTSSTMLTIADFLGFDSVQRIVIGTVCQY